MPTRRSFSAGALLAIAGSARAQTPAAPSPVDRLLELARPNIFPLTWNGAPSGPGWDLLAREAAGAEFVLLGEQHGIAEVPPFASALLAAMRPDRLIIETSGPMAAALDEAAKGGAEAIVAFNRARAPGPPFYGWRSEAQFLADARRLLPASEPVFWGIDYEIFWQDRFLLEQLKARAPAGAAPALKALEDASSAAWAKYEATHDFTGLYGIGGDVALIDAVRAAWGPMDPQSDLALTTLKDTVETNRLFLDRQGYASNQRRAATMRRNLMRYLQEDAAAGRRSRAMLKMGLTHATRGLNAVGGFDVGTLLPEVAAMRGGHAFSLMVIGGKAARHGQFNAATFKTDDEPLDDLTEMGLDLLAPVLPQTGVAVGDLRALRRATVGDRLPPATTRFINGYDAAVIWNGASAATAL